MLSIIDLRNNLYFVFKLNFRSSFKVRICWKDDNFEANVKSQANKLWNFYHLGEWFELSKYNFFRKQLVPPFAHCVKVPNWPGSFGFCKANKRRKLYRMFKDLVCNNPIIIIERGLSIEYAVTFQHEITWNILCNSE